MRPSARPAASRRRALAVLALLAASTFAVALVLVRIAYTGSGEYANLLWNLVLAWVPFVLALGVYDAFRRGVRPAVLAPFAALWVLFLPNAPYLLTEYVLLRRNESAPLWFDVTMLTTFAWTGLLLGFVSLYLMQAVVTRLAGPVEAWAGALAVLALCGLGIELGRFQRWNSWDAIADPVRLGGRLLAALGDPLAYPRAVAVTVFVGSFLTLAYLVLYSFLRLAEAEDTH